MKLELTIEELEKKVQIQDFLQKKLGFAPALEDISIEKANRAFYLEQIYFTVRQHRYLYVHAKGFCIYVTDTEIEKEIAFDLDL